MKIGIFDSGIGGLTVLNEILPRVSASQFFYFGDTANVPYGTKSKTHIQGLVTASAEKMKAYQLDALVIACNTAVCLAYDEFKKVLGNTILIDAVEAGVRASLKAAANRPNTPLLIFGTRATIHSHLYSSRLKEKKPELHILEQECPLLVPIIEEGWIDHPILQATVDVYAKPYRALPPGVALLGCTHYPWIKKAFQTALPGWEFIDSASVITEILHERVPSLLAASIGLAPTVEWHFSDPAAVSKTFLTVSNALPPQTSVAF